MTATTTRRQQLEAAAAQGAADQQTGTYDPFAGIPGANGDSESWPATTPVAPVQVVTRTKVVDCPSYAWDNSEQPAVDDIGAAFYGLHRPELDAAAHELIRPLLIAEWRKLGRIARLVDEATFVAVPDTADNYVDDQQRWTVWQAAADQISGTELVFAAGLVDEHAQRGER